MHSELSVYHPTLNHLNTKFNIMQQYFPADKILAINPKKNYNNIMNNSKTADKVPEKYIKLTEECLISCLNDIRYDRDYSKVFFET